MSKLDRIKVAIGFGGFVGILLMIPIHLTGAIIETITGNAYLKWFLLIDLIVIFLSILINYIKNPKEESQ